MTDRKVEQIITPTEHSFETVLGVPSGTTEMVKTVVTSKPVQHETYDDKDVEIDEDILVVHDKALELYDVLMSEIDDAAPNSVARLAEVAGQMLNTALSASEKRRDLKKHKDILQHKERTPGKGGGKIVTNNNMFVGSHEELMKMIVSNSEPPPIENEISGEQLEDTEKS